MKKILTLVVALALVFAIAAPALAITGDTTPAETDPTAAPVAISVELFTAPENLQFNGFNVSPIAANKAYVVNEVAFWGAAVAFMDATEFESTLNATDYVDSKLTISCDAFKLAAPDAYTKDAAGTIAAYAGALIPTLNAVSGKLELEFNAGEGWDSGVTYYYFGQGTVASKGVLKATLAKAAVSPLNIYKADGTLRYTVYGAEQASWTVIKGGDGDNSWDAGEAGVYFGVDLNNEVTEIEAYDTANNGGDVEFKKLISGGGSVVAAINDVTEGAAFTGPKAVYDEIMGFFGFNYDAEGRLLLKHFASKAALLNLKDEAAVQLYTAAIVVPGGVEPPKTGDTTTVIGFVMIALAMIAAGMVVSRKVRA